MPFNARLARHYDPRPLMWTASQSRAVAENVSGVIQRALLALGFMAMMIGTYWVLSCTGAAGDASVLADWLLLC